MKDNLFHAFISYSRKDIQIKDQLVKDLSNIGLRVWVDIHELAIGTSNWEKSIRAAIPNSASVLYLASETACASDYVKDELLLAERHNIPVIPVWVAGEHWIDCVPLGKGYIQRADLRASGYKKGLKVLAQAIVVILLERISQAFDTQKLLKKNVKVVDLLRLLIAPKGFEYDGGYKDDPFFKEFLDSGIKGDYHQVISVLDTLIEWGVVESQEIEAKWDKTYGQIHDDGIVYRLTKLGTYLCEAK